MDNSLKQRSEERELCEEAEGSKGNIKEEGESSGERDFNKTSNSCTNE